MLIVQGTRAAVGEAMLGEAMLGEAVVGEGVRDIMGVEPELGV